MEVKINSDYYDKYVEIYNDQGTSAAHDYVVNECGVKYDLFQRKMRRDTDYAFNKSIKKYEKSTSNEQFMSLEELCSTKKLEPKPLLTNDPGNLKFDLLIIELMRDRLVELQKFIHFEQSSKQIIVNSKTIKECGYVLTVS